MAAYMISPLSAPIHSLNITGSASITNGTQVDIYATSGSNGQNWVIDSLTSTSRQYVKHFSNQAYALNAYRSNTNWSCTLRKVSSSIDGYIILTKVANKTNVYTIRLSEYSNRYLATDGMRNSAKCFWRASTGGTEQQWEFAKIDTRGSGSSGATNVSETRAKFQKVGNYDGVNELWCADVVRWYIDTYTTLKSTSGHGKDLVANLANNYGLAINSALEAPRVFGVAGGYSKWGPSDSQHRHTGTAVSVDTKNRKATIIHTGDSLDGKDPDSWVDTYSYPTTGVTLVHLGSHPK